MKIMCIIFIISVSVCCAPRQQNRHFDDYPSTGIHSEEAHRTVKVTSSRLLGHSVASNLSDSTNETLEVVDNVFIALNYVSQE